MMININLMSNKPGSPIFYDPTEHRWRYYKLFVAISSVTLSVAFIATLYNIFTRENLPQLNIQGPAALNYRTGPLPYKPNTHFQSVITNQPAASTDNKNLNNNKPNKTVKKILPQSNNNVTPTGYKPKIIGFYVNWDDTSFTSLKANFKNMDELIPEWLHLADANGNIIVDDQGRQNATLDFLKKSNANLPVAPLINNYNSNSQAWDGDTLAKMLENPEARAKNINNLLSFIQDNDFTGISIDYESIPPTSQTNFVQFISELYAKFHPLNLEVSISVPIADKSFDLKNLSDNSDFLILMAYDEHSAEDPAGPVASQNWYAKSLANVLSQLDNNKIVVALGNYGYDWKGSETSNNTYSFQRAVTVAKESEGEITLDPGNLNETYTYYDDNNELHTVYFLDAVTAYNEMVEANRYKPRGFAMWRLGSEDPSIWQVFTDRQNLGPNTAEKIKTMDYGYGINYEGDGEVLKVSATPNTGKRELSLDKSGLITSAKMNVFPSPYIIDRWGATDPKKIALTFDDGPDPLYTPQILDILKKYNVPATFFIVGVNATQNRSIVEQEFAGGNEIASHTFTHPDISTESDKAFAFELNSVQSFLESTIGRRTLLFRPPYSEDVEPETPDQVKPLVLTTQLGYYTVGMHIDPKDWSRPGVDNIINSIVSSAKNKDGNIILLHDSGGDRSQTVAALPRTIESLQSQGFQLVTVSNLIGVSSSEIMPPVSGAERYVASLSNFAFLFINWALYLLSIAFTVGIILGIARFLFIAVLAAAQKIRDRHAGYLSATEFRPKVSIIIPAYNEEKVIVRTVKSILASDYPHYDIIVVDDGSADSTYEKVRTTFKNNPIVKIFTKPNGGKSEALNLGISETKAEIVVTLDADTIFKPNTITKLVRNFDNPKVGAVAGNAKVGNRLNLLTYWQALEYITSQNLDRRAFTVMNCITVVPGSVGAWRRKAVIQAGGFSNRTLAEDADLTFYIIRLGYKVVYEDGAIAYTEAPDTVKGFVKQRFRWMYGTLQTAWKHKEAINCPGCRALGFFAIPNIFIFQIFFPLISPFMDLTIFASLIWVSWQKFHHPVDYSSTYAFKRLFFFYMLFLLVDFATAAIAFLFERKEDWTLLFWMFLQRFFYRQLMYYVAIKVTLAAIKGKMVRWGNLERKATVAR
ncbi:MAG: glycosyltransferase [Candidatus Moraniibacteriota bacterium]